MVHTHHITHIHQRARGVSSPAYPHDEKRIHALDKFVLWVAIIAPFTSIPQVIKVYVEGSADLSVVSWAFYAIFSIPLIMYGLVHREKIVLFNSTLNFCMQVSVVLGIFLYS